MIAWRETAAMSRTSRRDHPTGPLTQSRARSGGGHHGSLGGVRLTLERSRRVASPILAAGLLMLIALQRVTLGTHPTYLGKYYAMLAVDPFHPGPDNPVGHRILAPLLSYVVGLRGPYLLYTLLLVVLALLAVTYRWFRSREHAPAWAVLGTSALALSMIVLTTLHYGGYPDALTGLLVFGAWWSRGRLAVSSAFYFLALLNHESALFLAPWLVAEQARAGSEPAHPWLRAVAAVGVSLIAFWGVRWALERTHPSVAYTLKFYLNPMLRDPLHWFRASAPHRWLGVAAAFNLYWLFPLLAATRMLLRGKRADAALLLLPIPCALAQLFVAYDVTRLSALAFMSVLLGAEYLLRTNGFAARRWAPLLCLANFFIPQVNVAMGIVDPMKR